MSSSNSVIDLVSSDGSESVGLDLPVGFSIQGTKVFKNGKEIDFIRFDPSDGQLYNKDNGKRMEISANGVDTYFQARRMYKASPGDRHRFSDAFQLPDSDATSDSTYEGFLTASSEDEDEDYEPRKRRKASTGKKKVRRVVADSSSSSSSSSSSEDEDEEEVVSGYKKSSSSSSSSSGSSYAPVPYEYDNDPIDYGGAEEGSSFLPPFLAPPSMMVVPPPPPPPVLSDLEEEEEEEEEEEVVMPPLAEQPRSLRQRGQGVNYSTLNKVGTTVIDDTRTVRTAKSRGGAATVRTARTAGGSRVTLNQTHIGLINRFFDEERPLNLELLHSSEAKTALYERIWKKLQTELEERGLKLPRKPDVQNQIKALLTNEKEAKKTERMLRGTAGFAAEEQVVEEEADHHKGTSWGC